MPVPTALSFVGVAKETIKGTGVAPTAFLPVKTVNPRDAVKYLPVNVLKGAMTELYGEVQGPIWSEFEIAGPVFPDTIGWPLAGILGDITTTGASAPFTHSLSLLNSGNGQPTSHTLTDFYGVTQARQYAGIQWHELQFKFTADGLLEKSAKATGLSGSTTVAKPTQSFTTVTPYPAWLCQVTIGGVAMSKAVDGEVTLTRKVTPIVALTGTQTPAAIFLGPLTVKGKFQAFIDDDTELTRYLTNTQPSLDFNWTTGSGAALVQLKLHMTSAAYTNAKITRGKDYVAIDAEFEAVANLTDAGASGGYSPIKATLQNAVAAGTYI